MKKLLVGTVVSLTAFASLWVALAGGTAGAAQTKRVLQQRLVHGTLSIAKLAGGRPRCERSHIAS